MSGNAAPSTGSRGLHVALIISLCINLVLVGIVAMAVVRMHFFAPPPFGGPGMMGGHGSGHGFMLRQMQESLTPQALERGAPAKADKIRSIMETHRQRIHELGTASIDARRQAFDVFSQPNFDKKGFDASLARVQAADAALEKEILSVVSDSAVALSPEERQAVASQRGHHGGYFWRHHFRHGGDGRDDDHGPQPPGPPPGDH